MNWFVKISKIWQFLLVLVSNAFSGVFLLFGKQQEYVVEQYIIE